MGGQHVKNDSVLHSSARSHDLCEKVLCMQTVKRDSRWCSWRLPGVFLGKALQSNDILVGRGGGVVVGARSFSEAAEG